ncbi:hypothetical protein WJX81_002646 [Elliptochloris bilobata]|uniref:F-box domain-containing protein n=1 Tax=Elliptochloris bilobata TaxID=381761 RepID=A0AAW1SF23_9CHLO
MTQFTGGPRAGVGSQHNCENGRSRLAAEPGLGPAALGAARGACAGHARARARYGELEAEVLDGVPQAMFGFVTWQRGSGADVDANHADPASSVAGARAWWRDPLDAYADNADPAFAAPGAHAWWREPQRRQILMRPPDPYMPAELGARLPRRGGGAPANLNPEDLDPMARPSPGAEELRAAWAPRPAADIDERVRRRYRRVRLPLAPGGEALHYEEDDDGAPGAPEPPPGERGGLCGHVFAWQQAHELGRMFWAGADEGSGSRGWSQRARICKLMERWGWAVPPGMRERAWREFQATVAPRPAERGDGGGERAMSAWSWPDLPAELVALVFASLRARDLRRGRLVCRGWRRALDATVTSLAVGPKAREAPPHHWNRQQLMMQRLPALFPCLRSLDFNQGIGSDLLVLPPGLPRNMAIVPRVPEVAVTASRTVEHALAMRALATRPSVTAFRLVLPMPLDDGELADIVREVGSKLVRLELQAAYQLSMAGFAALAGATQLTSLSIDHLQDDAVVAPSGRGWEFLTNLTSLSALAVRSRCDNDSGIGQVGRMAGLTDLRLRLKRMSAADAHALGGLTKLRSLDLEVWLTPATASLLTVLTALTSLRAVRLEAYAINDIKCCAQVLRKLPLLTHVDLRLSGSVGAADATLDAVRSLALCSRLNSLCLAAPATVLPALAAASALTSLRIGDAGLMQVVTGGELPELPCLRALNLKHCPRLHDAGLAAVVTSCPGLDELHLRAEELTGEGLRCLTVLTALTRLELLDARAAASQGLACAVAALTRLEELKIARTMKSFHADGRESDETGGLVAAARGAGALRGLLEVTEGYYPTCQGSLLRPLAEYIYL